MVKNGISDKTDYKYLGDVDRKLTINVPYTIYKKGKK